MEKFISVIAAAALIAGLGLATTALSASVANADPPCPPYTISLSGGGCMDRPEEALKAPGYPAGSCRPSANPPPSPDAVAASDCVNNTMPGGPPVARYEGFADQNTLNNAFQTDVRSTALQPCPGSSGSAPATWNATNPPPASGSVMCYTSNDNMAHVEWTNTPDLVKANASGPDMASLYGWWHGLITTA